MTAKKTNEYIFAVLLTDGWHWTVPSRLHPGTRTKSIHAHPTKAAALKAGRREYPHLNRNNA